MKLLHYVINTFTERFNTAFNSTTTFILCSLNHKSSCYFPIIQNYRRKEIP